MQRGDEMKKVYKYLLECSNANKIDRQTAIEMIKLLKQEEEKSGVDIAIIGMSVRAPGANTLEEFWSIVNNEIDGVSEFPEARKADIDRYLRYVDCSEEGVQYVKSGFLQEIDKFDYKFFHFSPKEASLMDPAQRIFLEVAWEALEDAGYGGGKLSESSTGVYIGFAPNIRDMYAKIIGDVDPALMSISMIGNLTAIIPSRLSYMLNLKGPSMVVDTACSSALVSVDLACQAIRNGVCEYAVVGGINLDTVPVDREYLRLGIESSDGRTRAFDENSSGSAIGEGVAAILLKPLSKALKDKDHVYAVIKGSASNQDGSSASLTAPNPVAQTEVIQKAWENAGIDPETITYIETHGTGTNLGDPIEIKGIYNAFKKYTNKRQFCAVSSVKPNIGHLCEAAGLVSLIKAVLALRHKQLPSSIYFNRPNKTINFFESPVYVNVKSRNWTVKETPRRCGVSSFGISGTNCHVVLEEAPVLPQWEQGHSTFHAVTLSALNEEVLGILLKNFNAFLHRLPEADIKSLSYVTNIGRGHYNVRLAIIARSTGELIEKLQLLKAGNWWGEGVCFGQFTIAGNLRNGRNNDEITHEQKRLLSEQAAEKIHRFLEGGRANIQWLQEACNLYVQGADIEWEALYQEGQPQKIPIPVYPFERSRCWIDIPDQEASMQNGDILSVYHKIVWVEEVVKVEKEVTLEGTVIVFVAGETGEVAQEVLLHLKKETRDVVEVRLGDSFCKTNIGSYVIQNREEDYHRLFSEFAGAGSKQIVHLLTCQKSEEIKTLQALEESQKKGIYSLFYTVRAIVNNRMEKDTGLLVVSPYVNDVTGQEERLHPEYATLAGIGKVIKHEISGLACRVIDIDNRTEAGDIIEELKHETEAYQVAYRNRKRYVEELHPYPLQEAEDQPVRIKEEGVYIITGGTGGIGLEIARYLSSKARTKIALLSRSGLPQRERWEDALKRGGEKTSRCIRAIMEMEATGSAVLSYGVDVCNMKAMEKIFHELREQFGRINGIFHCAGVAGGSFLIRRKEEEVNEVLKPKVCGTWVLDHLTSDDPPDFLMLCSSGLSLVGEPGNGDYTAANCYLGTYSAYRRKKGLKTLAVDWPSWKEVGMSVAFGINKDMVFKALPTAQALSLLEEALNKDINRVMVGEFSDDPQYLYMLEWAAFRLPAKTAAYLKNRKRHSSKGLKPAMAQQSREITLKGRDSAAFSEIEKGVAQIYHEVLGIEEIDIYDSFFELGGDSILLNRLYSLLDKEFPGKLRLIDAFSYTSIAAMAQFLAGEQEEAAAFDSDVDGFLTMFDRIGNGSLSVEEAIKTMSE
jgi:acyl transferase domain-containing protein/acyl carrier protein